MAKGSKSGPPDGGGNPYDRALGGRAAQRPEGLQACIAALDQGPDALAKMLDAFIEANLNEHPYSGTFPTPLPLPRSSKAG